LLRLLKASKSRTIGIRDFDRDSPENPSNDPIVQPSTEVFQLMGEGLSTSEISSRLHLSIHTIDTHREATQWLLENG
jgi:DNA-binding NarL/FixJ family response regulator